MRLGKGLAQLSLGKGVLGPASHAGTGVRTGDQLAKRGWPYVTPWQAFEVEAGGWVKTGFGNSGTGSGLSQQFSCSYTLVTQPQPSGGGGCWKPWGLGK